MSDFEKAVRTLKTISGFLKVANIIVAAMTMSVFFLTLFLVVISSFPREFPRDLSGASTYPHVLYTYSLWILAISCSAIIAVVFQETLRKRGNFIYEELSDELQRPGVRRLLKEDLDDNPSPVPRRRASGGLSVRLVLREFASVSDLPLVPGRFGPFIYVCANILLTISSIVIASQGRPHLG